MSFQNPFKYNQQTGCWDLELHKAPKDIYAQCGMKITVNPGIPTGEKGAYYQSKEPAGMKDATIEFRCFDNLGGWTSSVIFDFNAFIEKMISLMPPNKVRCETFILAERDLEFVKNNKKNDE